MSWSDQSAYRTGHTPAQFDEASGPYDVQIDICDRTVLLMAVDLVADGSWVVDPSDHPPDPRMRVDLMDGENVRARLYIGKMGLCQAGGVYIRRGRHDDWLMKLVGLIASNTVPVDGGFDVACRKRPWRTRK